jgi:L-ascorbate metabolism protein UlaG (beta-lactamase superfamily)
MVELQYFGHSFFKIKDKSSSILIDPVFSFGKTSQKDMGNVSLILLTNEMPEHFDKKAVEEIASRENATVVAHDSILRSLDVPRSQKAPICVNSELFLKGFKIKTATAHYPQSFYPLGYIIQCKDKTIYHAGVTALLDTFSEIKTDVAILPISSKSMDIVDVVRAAKMIKPKTLIPMQYDFFDAGKSDPKELKKRIEESVLDTETIILSPGKKINF